MELFYPFIHERKEKDKIEQLPLYLEIEPIFEKNIKDTENQNNSIIIIDIL